jgi:hypothetical protein
VNEKMNDRTGTGTSARRKLLRGVFAAPAVLTLHSGGAIAATSSQCDVKTTQSAIEVVRTSDDTYLRYQLWALVKQVGTLEVDSYYIQGDDLKTMVAVGFQPAASQWQQFDMASKKPSGSILYSKPAKSGQYDFVRVEQYVVLRVNNSGTVVGVGDAGTGLAVSDSCASSLVGAAVLRA